MERHQLTRKLDRQRSWERLGPALRSIASPFRFATRNLRGLNFSITAEDVNAVSVALNARSGTRVVSICSSGDTPLGLLALNAVEVDAVDISPAQIALARLKASAIANLSHDEAIRLLKALPTTDDPLSIYERIRDTLPSDTRTFWDNNREALAAGVLWMGRVQRMLHNGTTILKFIGGGHLLDQLRAIRGSDDADDFVTACHKSLQAKLVLALVFGRAGFAVFYPALGRRQLPSGKSWSEFAFSRLRAAVQRLGPLGNPYVDPLILDRQYRATALPVYLDPAHNDSLRERATRHVRFHTSDVGAFITALEPRSIGGFALCNVIDWLARPEWERLLRAVAVAAVPGARLVVFSRAPRRPLPSTVRSFFIENADAERLALLSDRTGYHESVYVLTVAGQGV